MARPSATAAAARVVPGVGLNVAFVLLLAFFCLSRRATGAGDDDADASASWRPGDGALIGEEARGHAGCEEERCAAYLAAGFDRRRRRYVDYLYLLCCVFRGERRALGYGAMAAWLAVLFYMLGDTAAVYFCASLEGLSRMLRLSPAIAGVTLLSLGNGAPDAISTVASFAYGGRGRAGSTTAVGLNGVLGGVLFVSSAVLGVIGLRLGGQGVAVDRGSFFQVASFLLLALAAVALVLAVGEVTIWGAVAFVSLYLVYVVAVAFTPDRWMRRHAHDGEADHTTDGDSSELHNVAETKFYTDLEAQEPLLPDTAPPLEYYAGAGDGGARHGGARRKISSVFWAVVHLLELPLGLPRRLTIPDATKERWSKPAAVTAATLAPLLLSFLCRHAAGNPSLAVLLGGLAGITLGIIAFLTTDPSMPPTRFLAAWLAGGFVMSMAWAYVIANEILSLLVSAGLVMSVDTATLGVTVLAWGNSLGDLVTNVAVASGAGGAQVAVSGCYGGPVFNVLVGLGVSMLLSCWAGYPQPVGIPREPSLYQTLGFVVAGLLWAMVMLPRREMRVDRTLGFGLLSIYFCFLCINISQVLGPKGQ